MQFLVLNKVQLVLRSSEEVFPIQMLITKNMQLLYICNKLPAARFTQLKMVCTDFPGLLVFVMRDARLPSKE